MRERKRGKGRQSDGEKNNSREIEREKRRVGREGQGEQRDADRERDREWKKMFLVSCWESSCCFKGKLNNPCQVSMNLMWLVSWFPFLVIIWLWIYIWTICYGSLLLTTLHLWIHLHSIRFLKEKVEKKLILHHCATQPQNEGHYSVVYLKTQKLQLINVKSI